MVELYIKKITDNFFFNLIYFILYLIYLLNKFFDTCTDRWSVWYLVSYQPYHYSYLYNYIQIIY